jgi:hypothetical protein
MELNKSSPRTIDSISFLFYTIELELEIVD